jgi:nicotinamidase-related amidase
MIQINQQRAVLLVIDIQDRLAQAMPPEIRDRLERNVTILVEAARRFALPVVVSEQYPKGLGATTARVAAALEGLAGVHRLEKLEFSVCDATGFPVLERDQWIVCGMEAHVCVWQSVRGLRARGGEVHVVADAVASRTDSNREIGLGLAERAGAFVTSTETVVFDLLQRAGSDDFKALSKLIK